MSYETSLSARATSAVPADVLPLPPVVDTPAVVLLHLLMGSGRPVVLDAGAVREVEPAAADALEAVLRAAREAGVAVRIENAGGAVRRRLEAHPLGRWLKEEWPWWDDELLFVSPDRDGVGFQPSGR